MNSRFYERPGIKTRWMHSQWGGDHKFKGREERGIFERKGRKGQWQCSNKALISKRQKRKMVTSHTLIKKETITSFFN